MKRLKQRQRQQKSVFMMCKSVVSQNENKSAHILLNHVVLGKYLRIEQGLKHD